MRVHQCGRRGGLRAWGCALVLGWLACWLAPASASAQIPPSEAAVQPTAYVPEGSPGSGPGPQPRTAVERAWRQSAASFEDRIVSTRRAALEVGAWNLDPAARALIHGADDATVLERAQAAVRLAPQLPAAHLHLARVLWIHEDEPMAALRSVVAGLAAIGGHPEASLWFAGSGLFIVAVALLAASLLLILLAGIAAARYAAHDLAHLLRVPVPPFAAFALLGALLLVPLALGEGVAGIAIALLAVSLFYGGTARRITLTLAAFALFGGLYALPRLAGAALSAFPDDPVARAAYTVAQGQASPVDLMRLERAADSDPLAMRGLAIHARQTGNLGRADAYYQRLLKDAPDDLGLINNAANVRLDLGHVDSALDLYDRALDLAGSPPVVLFNLSQAFARTFQVEELNETLAEAQAADGELVADFTALQRTENQSFVVDYPLTARALWARVLADPGGSGVARDLRRPFAPGRLGASPDLAGALLAGIVAFAWIASLRFQPSRGCARCGRRQCPRCGEGGGGELCQSCNRLFFEPEKTDRTLRVQRIEALRAREERMARLRTAGSVLVPGAAGMLARRPVRGLLGAFFFGLAVAGLVWRGGVTPDPLLAGPAAPVVFLGAAGVSAFLYVAIVLTSLRVDREF